MKKKQTTTEKKKKKEEEATTKTRRRNNLLAVDLIADVSNLCEHYYLEFWKQKQKNTDDLAISKEIAVILSRAKETTFFFASQIFWNFASKKKTAKTKSTKAELATASIWSLKSCWYRFYLVHLLVRMMEIQFGTVWFYVCIFLSLSSFQHTNAFPCKKSRFYFSNYYKFHHESLSYKYFPFFRLADFFFFFSPLHTTVHFFETISMSTQLWLLQLDLESIVRQQTVCYEEERKSRTSNAYTDTHIAHAHITFVRI